jgi:hypothetical protein
MPWHPHQSRLSVWPAPLQPSLSKRKMSTRYLSTLFLLILLVAAPHPAFPNRLGSGPADQSRVEKYHYQAVPIGKVNEKEDIELILSFEAGGIGFASKSVSEKAEEQIQVKMTGEGDLITGARSLISSVGRLTEAKIWRDGNKAYIERTSGKNKKTSILDIPDGATLAVDGSLLVLLRFFPCGSATRWDLFMIDFSGKSVAATARQIGIERIVVPAGEFSCYRMEVVIDIFILKPTIACWVTTEKPHFLVKSVGKRGVFTPKYVTTLVSKQ